MSEAKITEYVKSFIDTKSVKSRLKAIVYDIGQRCESEIRDSVLPSTHASQTELDLLVGSKILERPTGRTFKLTGERGREVYELIKKEELECRGHGDEGTT